MKKTVPEMQLQINSNFCFVANPKRTIKNSVAALEYFTKMFDAAVSLSKDIPIFLDTNVLLSYYGMAASEKSKLITFFRKNKGKLHLTTQVQKEYLANREKNIKTDLFTPLEHMVDDLSKVCEKVRNDFTAQINKNKKILSKDYPTIWEKLSRAEGELATVMELNGALADLNQRIEETTKDYKDITFSDDLLKVCAEFVVTPEISEEEIKFLEDLFDSLSAQHKLAVEEKRNFAPFPGLGDFKGKDYPYGDFIIFHEILKFMKTANKDAIFLTNEKSKGDWMGTGRSPHLHYIELAYELTGRMLFILNAEEPLKLSMENIHDNAIFDPNIERESPVLNIATSYGFVYGRNGRDGLFFHKSSFKDPSEFDHLQNQDFIRFKVIENNGRPYLIDAKAVSYDLGKDNPEALKGEVYSLSRNYGGVTSNNGKYVFHAVNVDKVDNFSKYQIGDKVEFLLGLNLEGEPIIRKIRRISAGNIEPVELES